ncbi:MAG: exo-alpha-sialidase [Planctomycetales bacterium]|nr:exo-alpha-sialidase [Planctomycetales bacterium]
MQARKLTFASTLAAVCGLVWSVAASTRADDTSPTNSVAFHLVESRLIWNEGAHNAFTDLIRFRDTWYCTFREAKGHVSPRGMIRVIRSDDGEQWQSAALLKRDDADLRDSKLSIAPDGKLMLLAAASWHEETAPVKRQPMVWFSDDGSTWTEGVEVGEKDFWLWRVTWNEGCGLGVGYLVRGNRFARLYHTRDGKHFETLVDRLFDEGSPNEATIRFLANGDALCLLRRDGSPATGQLGRAAPPYKDWQWRDLKTRIGGPNFVQVPSGELVAVCRLYDGGARTSVCLLDAEKGTITEKLKLPSGGDTSYAGLVWREDLLWISYYSSHEGKTSIYLAKVSIGE